MCQPSLVVVWQWLLGTYGDGTGARSILPGRVALIDCEGIDRCQIGNSAEATRRQSAHRLPADSGDENTRRRRSRRLDRLDYHEDHFTRTREELQAYLNGPDDPLLSKRRGSRRGNPPPAARTRPAVSEELSRGLRPVELSWTARRPLTMVLVATCVVVFLLQRSASASR